MLDLNARRARGALAAIVVFCSASAARAQAVAPPPAAQSAGSDAVILKDGTTIRGTLIEVITNQRVRIQVEGGKIATIIWDVIERVEEAPRVAPPPVTPPPVTPPVAPPPPQAGPTTVIHIDSPVPVLLEREWAEGAWQPVCESPCDAPLPVGSLYRIGGPGTRRSKPFVVSPQNGRVSLDVDRASTGGFALGITLVTVGPVVFLVGVVVTLLGWAESRSVTYCSAPPCPQDNNGSGMMAAGFITMGVGAVGTVIGAVLLGGNLRTKVGQFGAPVQSAGPDWVRRPTWYGERPVVPATPWSVPIVSATF